MDPGTSTPYGDFRHGTGTIVHVDGVCLFGDFQAQKLMKFLTVRDPVTLFLAVTEDLASCPKHTKGLNHDPD